TSCGSWGKFSPNSRGKKVSKVNPSNNSAGLANDGAAITYTGIGFGIRALVSFVKLVITTKMSIPALVVYSSILPIYFSVKVDLAQVLSAGVQRRLRLLKVQWRCCLRQTV